MVTQIRVNVYTRLSLRARAGLDRLLDAFEQNRGLIPTHWAPGDPPRLRYDRNEATEGITAIERNFTHPTFKRTKPPRFEAFLGIQRGALNFLNIDFKAPPEDAIAGVFEFGDALASRLDPVFGYVHPVAIGHCDEYGDSGYFKPGCFETCGPRSIYARTWLGPALAKAVRHRLRGDSKVVVTDMPHGGFRLDLIEQPWTHLSELPARQKEVVEPLAPLGIFGDYSQFTTCEPGPGFSL